MPKAREYYVDAKGDPIVGSADVTPTWWKLRRRSSFGPVAAMCAKFPYATNVRIGLDGVRLEFILPKGEDVGGELVKFVDALEASGSEWREPELDDA